MTAYAMVSVSRELGFRAEVRPLLREVLRESLAGALGREPHRIRFAINPFERHGDLDAPLASDAVYIVKAGAR